MNNPYKKTEEWKKRQAEFKRAWWATHRPTHCPNGHEYTEENSRPINAPSAHTRRRCRICERAKRRRQGFRQRPEVKLEVLTHYGKNGKLQCCWLNCEIIDIDILELDHINNNGAEDRKKYGRSYGGFRLMRILREAGYPSGYQTLCCNHNRKKEILRRRAQCGT